MHHSVRGVRLSPKMHHSIRWTQWSQKLQLRSVLNWGFWFDRRSVICFRYCIVTQKWTSLGTAQLRLRSFPLMRRTGDTIRVWEWSIWRGLRHPTFEGTSLFFYLSITWCYISVLAISRVVTKSLLSSFSEGPGCRCVANGSSMGRRRVKFEVSKRWARWRTLLNGVTQKCLIWTYLLNISWHSLCQLSVYLKQINWQKLSLALRY